MGFLCFFATTAFSQKNIDPTPEDVSQAKQLREKYSKDDIAILESTDDISFDFNKKAGKVIVNHNAKEHLMNINYRADIHKYEFYDSETSIETGGTAEAVVAGRRLRAPALRDLAAVAHELDAERAARQLVARCTLYNADTMALSDDVLRDVENALEAVDPNADIALEVHCEACGEHCTAVLDIGVLLWDEIDACARALLAEVHTLAGAYGWTEGEVLALGAARRASYLAMVGS